jgi:hypothetical protein
MTYYMKKKVVRMAVSNNMSLEKIVARYPELTYEEIDEAVGGFLQKRNATDARDGCMGGRDEAYWQDENSYASDYNPLAGLKLHHLAGEIPKQADPKDLMIKI